MGGASCVQAGKGELNRFDRHSCYIARVAPGLLPAQVNAMSMLHQADLSGPPALDGEDGEEDGEDGEEDGEDGEEDGKDGEGGEDGGGGGDHR